MDVITLKELLTKDIKGKVVCFPTDTVYGVGALINDSVAIDKIYHLKINTAIGTVIIIN